MIRKIISALILTAVLTGCYYDKEELLYPGTNDCSTLSPSFTTHVMPIIQTSCAIAGCHDATSGNKGGPFVNYNQVKDKASTIKSQVLSGAMPQGSSLTSAQIQVISCWVSSGAVNN